MISKFWIQNFKSYDRKSELPLAPLTFLIGANASGKSNAIEAIRILKWISQGQRLDDLTTRGTGPESYLRGQPQDFFHASPETFELGVLIDDIACKVVLDIGISLIKEELAITSEKALSCTDPNTWYYEIEGKANERTDEIQVSYNNFSRGRNKPRIPCSNQQAIFYQLQSPGAFNNEHETSKKVIPEIAKCLRENLKNIEFLDPRPAAMRGYAFIGDKELNDDGSNVSSVLFRICNESDESKRHLLNFIRSLPEQDIQEIQFIKTTRNEVMVELRESFKSAFADVPAPSLSDGTLRVLAIAAILLTAKVGSCVIIEEIDNGVHPSRAKTLVENIQKVCDQRKLHVLLTTHNPALLDAIPDRSLADVLCCYRDRDDGDSRIVRLGDLPRYPELVAQASLGELVTTRVLDRFVKDKTTEEERTQQSLKWLKDLKAEASE